jgi:tetratricopeptide (TPR) repeat protein
MVMRSLMIGIVSVFTLSRKVFGQLQAHFLCVFVTLCLKSPSKVLFNVIFNTESQRHREKNIAEFLIEKVNKSGILLLLCLFGSCYGESYVDNQMEKANIYVEAGEYERARLIYEDLLGTVQDSWKKSILEYDLATVYLQEGHIDDAIKGYSAISLGKEPFPLLTMSIKQNLAIARWKIARKIVDKMTSGQNYYEEDYIKAIFLLYQALLDVKAASQAHCDLLLAEGDNLCTPSYSLNKLRDALQQQLAVVEVQHQKVSLETMTPKIGVPALLAGIYAIRQEIVQLLSLKMPVDTKNEQVQHLLEQAVTWEQVWDSLEGRTEGNEHFIEAKDAFFTFISHLSQGNLKRSLVSIKNAEDHLNAYMGLLYDQDSVLEFIDKLLVRYERAQLMVPVQESEIKSLYDQQKTLLSIFNKKNINTSILEDSIHYLENSLSYAVMGKHKSARIYLTVAFQIVKRFKWAIEITTHPSIEEFLEQLISEQMSSILVNYLMIQIESEKNVKNSALDIQTQEETLSLASNFWNLAKIEQKEDYHQPRKEGEENLHRCQYQPWSQVIPLFDKGFHEAQKAMGILRGAKDKHPALIHQDGAMRFWREALEKLKSTPPQESCEMGGQSEDNQESDPQDQDQQPQDQQQDEQKSSINDTLRLLQKMEQDDRQKKGKTGKIRSLEEKAW